MPYAVYVSIQGEDKILQFAMDEQSGALERLAEVPAPGAPGPMTIDPTRRFLYAARRGDKQISSFAIDGRSGALSLVGTVGLESDPPFLNTDKTGRFMLSSYYAAGKVAVHPIRSDGAVTGPPIEWIDTATGAHSVQTDPSNRFAFLPHIADRGPNEIWQFRFDERSGRLTPNSPAKAVPPAGAGPRHFCFHPSKDVVYFCNEQGCSVTAYALDASTGTLSALQTVSTLPDGFQDQNTCAEIRIAPSGRYVYASNRGHNSIARFAVDAGTGLLTALGQTPTEAMPRAFSLDPEGKFLIAAGQESGRLSVYRLDDGTGALEPLATYAAGVRPMWISILDLPA
jgi:6-phosphogluconolactonase